MALARPLTDAQRRELAEKVKAAERDARDATLHLEKAISALMVREQIFENLKHEKSLMDRDVWRLIAEERTAAVDKVCAARAREIAAIQNFEDLQRQAGPVLGIVHSEEKP